MVAEKFVWDGDADVEVADGDTWDVTITDGNRVRLVQTPEEFAAYLAAVDAPAAEVLADMDVDTVPPAIRAAYGL